MEGMNLKAWIVNGSADAHNRVQMLLSLLKGAPSATEVELEKEWRCWREDGSYYGPCSEAKKFEWSQIECEHGFNALHRQDDKFCYGGGGWNHRHTDCGWQFYIMAEDIK